MPILKSCVAIYNEDVIAHSVNEPKSWYVKIIINRFIKDTFLVLFATYEAVIAKIIDFTNINGRTIVVGIPNNNELTIGDKTAVSKPTLSPYLYDAIRVKK